MGKKNSFSVLKSLGAYHYYSLTELAQKTAKDLTRLPYSIRILLENLLRTEDSLAVSKADIEAVINWEAKKEPTKEIQFTPARIVLQDFTGVPAVCDMAAMRSAFKRLGGNADEISPLQPVDLVIDHSVQVDYSGSPEAMKKNTKLEYERNQERYQFLRWGQKAFSNFQVVPPETGIVHQVNLERLAPLAMTAQSEGKTLIFPDTVVGTDSHTTMINGLGVVGWGVGGIEAEAAMLGQPISMLLPQVVGVRLTGSLRPGVTATDLVLTATQMLRKHGVVGLFVEFFGPGLHQLPLADRATIANMAPEYGATIGVFPVDEQTLRYLKLTGRPQELLDRVEKYFKAQGLWYSATTKDADYSAVLELDLSSVVPSMAGPTRPQDRIELPKVKATFEKEFPKLGQADANIDTKVTVKDAKGYEITNGSTVIAAITSCTNTSNPSVLIAAGLLAKKAVERGLRSKPWVKTSLAPGSKVVTDYLKAAGLLEYLEKLNFHVVGYGCTTCIGNSGPLSDPIVTAIKEGKLVVSAVLSGNRNFEARISPHVRANFLASPPLVVAHALSGTVRINFDKDPIGTDLNGQAVFLKDLWPSPQEIAAVIESYVTSNLFSQSYADVFKGGPEWNALVIPSGKLYEWNANSSYIKEPPFFRAMRADPDPITDIRGAYCLVKLLDSVTTDHISPAGSIGAESPAGRYLIEKGVAIADFNSFGSRRGNHEVMIRGTFDNVRLKNQLRKGTEGGVTVFIPTKENMSIYDASMRYQKEGLALIALAGKEYGSGSSRDWAAKGTRLLGIRAVIAESFERIHRSNLIGMGVLPLQYVDGQTADILGLTGFERFDIEGLLDLHVAGALTVKADKKTFSVRVRIDTPNELEYFRHGGILPYVLRQKLSSKEPLHR